MAGANSNIQLSALDFDLIKQNFITYLLGQDVLKDANYTGSVLSNLLDILSYNTTYNGYYLSMVSNEMYLDTATRRSSVVSRAKDLGYTPTSIHSCVAIVNFSATNLIVPNFTLPKYTKFLSEKLNDKFYTFLVADDYTVDVVSGTATINNVELIEGEPSTIIKAYSKNKNPKSSFVIPDNNVDINTLTVRVKTSTTDSTITNFYPKENFNYIDSNSLVYYINETNSGFYEVYFGDGILGKALNDGNIVILDYIVSSGIEPVGAQNFKLIDNLLVSGTINPIVTINPAFGGSEKQSIDSIRFSAPKYYAAQNRAITYQDYITALMNNKQNFSFDAVNVWGGQENDPPVFGKVFLSIKPTGAYTLTQAQKDIITNKIIKPISMVTIDPIIIDPDYTFLNFNVNVLYDPTKTLLSAAALTKKVKSSIYNFSNINLNSFNSVFSLPNLLYNIQTSDPSILTNDVSIKVEKKFFPNLTVPTTYTLKFGFPLAKGGLKSSVSSSPELIFNDKENPSNKIYGVFIEEIPTSSGGIDAIFVTNSGYGYTSVPTVTITGDGIGANAHAVIVNGGLKEVVIDDTGSNYTTATISINGGGGQLANAAVSILGRYGTLRLAYYDNFNNKVVYDNNIGTIDYDNGIITLNSFSPLEINNSTLGKLTVSAIPKNNILYSQKNNIITLDPFNVTDVVINVSSLS